LLYPRRLSSLSADRPSPLCSSYPNVNASRRTFIFAGVLGAAALVATRWLPRASPTSDRVLRALDADGEAIVTAILPLMLTGALPQAADDRAAAVHETVAAVDAAIAGLPPHAQRELQQLFTLLALAPARWSLARMTASWPEAPPAAVDAFLSRLKDSRIALLRAAYDALHQLMFAAWYGQPRAWSAIGYDGPAAVG
jgi:hypothetical protein